MWASFGALGSGRLGAALGEQIAVAVAERNGCHDCLAAHSALRFALALVEQRGRISAEQLQALKGAGFDDGEAMEILAHVALNLFTNYVNNAFETPLDFPAVPLMRA